MKKKQKGLFFTLISSYIVFSFALVISLVLAIMGGTGAMVFGTDPVMDPYDAIYREESVLYNLGGWAEFLDTELNVIKVQGEKKDDVWQYTWPGIVELTNLSLEDLEYKAFIKKTDDGYAIFKLPRNQLLINYSIEISNNNPQGFIGYFIAAVFIVLYVLNCVLMSLYLKRRISKPMRELEKGILTVKNGGEDIDFTSKGPQEFIEIQSAFKEMVQKLNEKECEKKEMEASRTRMLLSLSHDIKTPITTIKMYSAALRDGLVCEEKSKDYLHTIDAKATHVADLSNDMFTMLKMEDADYKIELKKHNACEIMRKVCSEFYDEIEIAGLELVAEIPDEPVFVSVDYGLFERALSNLLSNAIKYNKAGNKVLVAVKASALGGAKIIIADDGTPISADTRKVLFDAFGRGDAARTSTGGSGLGISIAKGIVEKHEGALTYDFVEGTNKFTIII